MTCRSIPKTDGLLWRAPFHPTSSSLADALRQQLREVRPHLLDFLRLDEPVPHQAMTLAQWSQPAQLHSLLAAYGNHIYRHHLNTPRETKPLLSLWAQWYVGLQVPPLMLALLTHPQALDLSPEHFHVEFHETGRASCFWIDVHHDAQSSGLSSPQRMERLITHALYPVVEALESTGAINGKLIWSNTGYLINWYLGEMKSVLGEERVNGLRQHLFFEKQFSDGLDNPLWRTVVLRDGLLVRRTCCQRNRLPDVQQCGDCTLK